MIIELQRALLPEDRGEEPCALCGIPFHVGSVAAIVLDYNRCAVGDERLSLSAACPSCVAYLGSRNPSRFPTLEEYEAAQRRYPEPVFADEEEMSRAEDAGTFIDLHMASFIGRE